jgi:hypothetical protein
MFYTDLAAGYQNEPQIREIFEPQSNHQSILSLFDFKWTDHHVIRDAVFHGENAGTINWTGLEMDSTEILSHPTSVESSFKWAFHKFSIDPLVQQNGANITDPVTFQLRVWQGIFSRDFNNKFLNNDVTTGNARSFQGIRGWMRNPVTNKIPTELKRDLGGIDLRPSAMTLANAQRLVYELEIICSHMCDNSTDFSSVVIFLNTQAFAGINAAIRLLGAGSGFETTRDAFDRFVVTYRGARFFDPGNFYPNYQINPILPNTESASGVSTIGSNFTSLLFAKVNTPGLEAFTSYDRQRGPIYRIEGQDGKTMNYYIRMGYNFLNKDPKTFAQMHNLRFV